MIKLVYDIKCGFKQLYMTEKDVEYDLSYYTDPEFFGDEHTLTEEELYNQLKDMDQAELEEYFTEDGTLGIIAEGTMCDYAHSYFKDICFADKEHSFVPGYIKIYNLRVICDPAIKVYFETEGNHRVTKYREATLRAQDVMAILGISRQTLSNWVKKGLIKATEKASGHYEYDADSVMRLKEGK